jgi:hypothetical protein
MIQSKYLKILGFLLFAVSGMAPAREPRTYSYLARKVPSVLGENCHIQAKSLAQRFSKLTGLTATGSCYAIQPEENDLLIQYQASEPLNVISSVPDLDFPGRGYEFSTQGECESEIEKEKLTFQLETGSQPLLAFCPARENYYGLKRWALVLEGFGNQQTQLAWSSSRVPGRPSAEQIEKIRAATKEKLTRQGVNVRFVFIQEDEKGQLRLNTLYYGRYNEQLKGFSLASINSLEDCHQALQDFQRVETAHPHLSSIASCISNPYSRGADLFVVVDVLHWFQLKQSAESFASYSQCASEKNHWVDFYQKEVSANTLEGFCTEWGSDWKINFIHLPATP